MIGPRKVNHVQVKFNRVVDQAENGSVFVDHITSGNNCPDFLTNFVIDESFTTYRKNLGVISTNDEHGLKWRVEYPVSI